MSPTVGRLFSAGLLALALVLAQQHAVLHWLSHALGQTSAAAALADKAAPATSQHCADCDALASFGATAPPPAAIALALPAVARLGIAHLDALAPGSTPWLAYRSRAPPVPV